MNSDQRTTIQNMLVALAQAFVWPKVYYANGVAKIEDRIVEPAVVPESAKVLSCFCNETDAIFTPNDKQGRRQVQSRESWTFELTVKTDVETSAVGFEKSLCDTVKWLTPADGSPPCEIRLMRSSYTHPVQGQASGGSSIKFIVRAIPRRA